MLSGCHDLVPTVIVLSAGLEVGPRNRVMVVDVQVEELADEQLVKMSPTESAEPLASSLGR